MKGKLLLDFEDALDKEAQRIANILIEKYNKKEKLNMSFNDAVRKYIKKEYMYYSVIISFKTYLHIPNGLTTDPLNIDVFVSKEESTLRHINRYANYCIKNKHENKNPNKAATEFAKIIIEMNNKNELGKLSLPTILAQNMSKLYPYHNDSMDAEAVMLYLQDAIEKDGYSIYNVDPLVIRKVNNE